MSIRIVHTADNHLGLKFAGRAYPPELRKRLVEERFEALERVVRVGNDANAHILAVAGDLFDNLHVAKNDIKRTASILNQFTGLAVIVLPGNHDFLQASDDTLWGTFRSAMKEQLLILCDRPEPVSLTVGEKEVVFYPAPCTSKHSDVHAIGWIAGQPKPAGAVRIGLAHGSVSGISPDLTDRYYPMSEGDLRGAGVDFWLLGHTHIRYPMQPSSQPSLFYIPSTHTPDGFDCDHEGYVWVLDVADDGGVAMESVRTGALRFYDWERTISSGADLQACRKETEPLDASQTLLKLTFKGRLSDDERDSLQSLAADLAARFLYAECETRDVALNITQEHIDREYSQQSLPHRLLSSLARRPEDDLALQLASELIREAQR